MIVLYVLQTDPNFTLSSGTGPVLVLPFAVAVAMFDGQLAGGLFGLFAGILCDTSSSVLFGFGSILYLVICTAVGLLVLYFMQPSLTNSLIFTGSGFAVRLLLEYFFTMQCGDMKTAPRFCCGICSPICCVPCWSLR